MQLVWDPNYSDDFCCQDFPAWSYHLKHEKLPLVKLEKQHEEEAEDNYFMSASIFNKSPVTFKHCSI